MPIFDRKKCAQKYSDVLQGADLDTGEICAGGEFGKSTCDGDGGSPLVCESKSGHWHAVGLVSCGKDCKDNSFPGVFANIYNYLNFIIDEPQKIETTTDDPRG